MKTTTPQLIGSAEACRRLGVGRPSLVRMVQTGRLEAAMKLPGASGAYLFDPETVDALVTERAR